MNENLMEHHGPEWPELPCITGGEDFTGTFFDGRDRNYSYCYNFTTLSSTWVAYPLYRSTMYGKGSSQRWEPNPEIAQTCQIDIWDGSYGVGIGGTIYSRGHQIPNGDRSRRPEMQRQTYYATNCTPQILEGFNDGIWSALEQAARDAVPKGDTIYVVTGPGFRKEGGTMIKPKWDSRCVRVADFYWKALLKVKRSGSAVSEALAIGFILEHRQHGDEDYASCATSVDTIEGLTGLNLFYSLPATLREKAESNGSWETFLEF